MKTSNDAAGWRLGGVGVAAAAAAAVLVALGQLLVVPSGFGVEDLLGWTGPTGACGQTAQMLHLWEQQLLDWAPVVAGAYLVLDLALFMPLYGLLLAGWWWQVQQGLAAHAGRPAERRGWLTRTGGAWVLALWLVDLVENVAGLHRMGLLMQAAPVAAIGAGLCIFWIRRQCNPAWLGALWGAARPAGGAWRWAAWLFALLAALGVAGAYAADAGACAGPTLPLWAAGCRAHGMKPVLVAMLVAGPLPLLIWVQYGPHALVVQWPRVVAVRGALVMLFWRTRYVLAALAACAALMLVMDQGRDVVYAMASHPWRGDGEPAALWASMALALGLTGVATWLLGHTCWLWTRLVLRVANRQRGTRSGPLLAEDHLARLWARLLGITPALLVLGMVLAVLPQAVVLEDKEPIVVLLAFAAAVVVGTVCFIWQRDKRSSHDEAPYYASHTLRQTIALGLEMRLLRHISPVTLPAVALLLALVCRALGQWGGDTLELPTLTLPIVLCLVAFWLGIAGWVSLYEESESVPWFLIALALMGLLGLMGWTENHGVPASPGGATLAPASALVYTCVLGAVLGLGAVVTARQLADTATRAWKLVACGVMVVLGSAATVLTADTLLPQPAPVAGAAATAPAPASAPVSAHDAVAQWLATLCPSATSGACAGAALPVTLVMAEGGGIRSAYWTALVLERLHATRGGDAGFDHRSFAMTGVSGGALGIAVYRACRAEALRLAPPGDGRAALSACIDRFGRQDLLAPLVGAWFFEDAIARWLPLGCDQPGCGLLSRGLWFEGAMLQALPGLAHGLADSRSTVMGATGGHVPFALLNSTWVETGERAIASELPIDWREFPGARDQRALLGQADLPLVTAAHNSARFPFTNALGAVRATTGACEPRAYGEAPQVSPGPVVTCGHLADGGYFDSSAGHTVADLLRLVQACVRGETPDGRVVCAALGAERRQSLANRLQLEVVFIRNGVGLGPLPVSSCRDGAMPTLPQLAGEAQPHSAEGLRQPRCASSQRLFVDALGPLWTALAAIGTGANGRLAAALPDTALHTRMTLVDLRENGPLYPLGWHLSPAARRAMRVQAEAALPMPP